EVRARDARRGTLSGEVVLDADLALLGAEAARDPVELRIAFDTRVVRREVPRLLREVLQRDVLELRALLDEELDDRGRVAGDLRMRGGVLLDQREARALFRDDEQAPEQRPAVRRVRDAHVQRLVEYDAARNDDEQAALPERRVVRGELLVPADELVQARVVVGEKVERHAVR